MSGSSSKEWTLTVMALACGEDAILIQPVLADVAPWAGKVAPHINLELLVR